MCSTVACWTVAAIGPSGTERVKLEHGKENARSERACPTDKETLCESAYWEERAGHMPEISKSRERAK